jgi:hypothetical protein
MTLVIFWYFDQSGTILLNYIDQPVEAKVANHSLEFSQINMAQHNAFVPIMQG